MVPRVIATNKHVRLAIVSARGVVVSGLVLHRVWLIPFKVRYDGGNAFHAVCESQALPPPS